MHGDDICADEVFVEAFAPALTGLVAEEFGHRDDSARAHGIAQYSDGHVGDSVGAEPGEFITLLIRLVVRFQCRELMRGDLSFASVALEHALGFQRPLHALLRRWAAKGVNYSGRAAKIGFALVRGDGARELVAKAVHLALRRGLDQLHLVSAESSLAFELLESR